MNQSIALVTLGVGDYERAKAFYSVLGWKPAREIEETAFYQANGVVLVLWAREELAVDMGIADNGATWSGIVLAHNVSSREEGEWAGRVTGLGDQRVEIAMMLTPDRRNALCHIRGPENLLIGLAQKL